MESKMSGRSESKNVRVRRQFTDEFKAGTIRLIVEERQSYRQVSMDLDIAESVLRGWVRQWQARHRGPAGGLSSSEQEELARLRKENRVLKMERDILKKAAAFFAKEKA